MSKEKKEIVYIDIKGGIDKYNQAHPDLKPLNKKQVAEILHKSEMSVHKWQKGVTPDVLKDVHVLLDLFGMGYSELVKIKNV